MTAHRTRTLVTAAAAVSSGLLLAVPGPAAASSGAPATFHPGRAIYDVPGLHPLSAARVGAPTAATSFPQYKATVKVGTSSYTYTIVGRNPAKQITNPLATVKVELVPLVISFSGTSDTWDPSVIDSCDPGASALTRTQNSPIFKPQSWTFGGTAIGTGQVTDAFQRAEFWTYAQPAGINPGYGIKLAMKTLAPVSITVPVTEAATASIGCGNGLLGAININWLDPYLQSTVIPSLAASGVGPTTLPIFLLHNVVEYIGTTSNCCVLGYHNAYAASSGTQTYGLSIYDNSRAFTGSSDISALSHEVGEWQNDPYGSNPTPAWGHVGQVSGCQNNLEVGDPLSGTTFTDTVGGFAYHPQELAFFSWFYHQATSLGVNGWYSDQGTFTTFAAACT